MTPFTKNKELKNLEKTRDSIYLYHDELHKTRFQHDMTHKNVKYLTRRTASHKVLHSKSFNIAKNPKYKG